MVTQTPSDAITAAEAAELALITYRQLDHWARQQWVMPSIDAGGHGRRRLYSGEDVLGLASLRHFAKSGWQVNDLGPTIGDHDLGSGRWFVIASKSGLHLLDTDAELRDFLANEEQFSVYDLEPLRSHIANKELPANHNITAATPLRRHA